MSAKWWANPETFNEKHGAKVDEVIKNEYANNNRYNPETQTLRLYNDITVLIRKAEYYQPPPELIEFCCTMDKICKPHAHRLYIKEGEPYHLFHSFWDQDARVNYMDWVGFLGYKQFNFVYVNCNSQSEHYGQVMVVNNNSFLCKIIYKNVHEFSIDLLKWLAITGNVKTFDLDAYLNTSVESYKSSQWTTYREILMLTDDTKPVRRFKKDIQKQIEYSTMYKKTKAACLSAWIGVNYM